MSTFTQNQLEISNKSYVNKDFEAVYTELLDIAEKISKRFSPKVANEADPFIILLKLMASVTDKVNYNVDKNILEQFMLSCTQDKSMRELTDMLGYSMKYYRSAETSVIFKYNFNNSSENLESVEIPAFSILTDGDSIQYVTVENTKISRGEDSSSEISAIQGKLKDLEILGNKVIQLENLNSKNRLYLPEIMIAENGVSISNNLSNHVWKAWKASDNLNVETYGSFVYKFGFDSVKNLPYIDFPSWISNIIGKGLSIKYIVTSGSAGNIPARALTTLSRMNAPDDDVKDEDIKVLNLSSATSGCDPETLSEAYNGFKKIIGTFDTLVTCRDYANKIYTFINNYGNHQVSNVQVGDRRIDINYACDVLTMSNLGSYIHSNIPYHYDEILDNEADFENKASKESIGKIFYIKSINQYMTYGVTREDPSSDLVFFGMPLNEKFLTPEITPYDLCIYALSPIHNTSYIAVNDANGYNKSYELITNASDLRSIQLKLEDSKTLSHTYKQLKNSDIGYIQNLYKLDATISTIRKVNILEQHEILTNINNALISKYNPRNLNFGNEIAFDELLSVIELADNRIKSVSLQEPEQSSKIILRNNTAIDLYDDSGRATDQFKFIISKNILSGRVEVFDYDTDFNYTVNQKNARKYENIIKASTACNIPSFSGGTENPVNTEYTLNSNEIIQFLAPNLTTELSYPNGINYYLSLGNADLNCIPKNTEYKLKGNDLIVFTYTDNNDDIVIIPYSGNDGNLNIIKPNFNLYTTAYRVGKKETPTKSGIKNDTYPTEYASEELYKFYTLTADQSIDYRTLSSDKLNTFKRCYWLTNQTDNEIVWEKTNQISDNLNNITNYLYTYILKDNEYFFYSDSNLSTLYSYGSGTRLNLSVTELTNDNASNPEYIPYAVLPKNWKHNNYVNIEDITINGLSALDDYFIRKVFSDDALTLDIIENEIITLTEGDTIQVINSNSDDFTILDNTFTNIPNNITIKYKFSDENYTSLPDRSSFNDSSFGSWSVKSTLDLNCGPNKPQKLLGNQKVTFVTGFYDSIGEVFIELNEDVHHITLSSDNGDSFESNYELVREGGENINLQYMDLDLKYKCPSILHFKDSNEANCPKSLNDGFYSILFNSDNSIDTIDHDTTITYSTILSQFNVSAIDANTIISVDQLPVADINYFDNNIYYNRDDEKYYKCFRLCKIDYNDLTKTSHDINNEDEHEYKWQEIDKFEPNHRLFMIYVDSLDKDLNLYITQEVMSEDISKNKFIRLFNKNLDDDFSNVIILKNGMNIIEVRDIIENGECNLCESLAMGITASFEKDSDMNVDKIKEKLSNLSCMLSQFKVVKGLNPLLGINEDDNILEFIYHNFNSQFKEFFICADLDSTKHIELSEDYKLNSAQAFYDSNNIANKWVMCKIDFPSSNIKIARNSKK